MAGHEAPARTLVMGVLNVTEDSFSDGGLWADADAAIAHAFDMVAEGADILDVGGESTRPGSARVPERVELERVVPVVRALADAGVAVSVDTTRATVAEASIAGGASWINDVSGGLADPAMLPAVADGGCGYITMHWRGHATEMDSRAVYTDVVAEVRDELAERRDAALAAGIDAGRLVLDPGFGFGKRVEHNYSLLRELARFGAGGLPVLAGLSRKSMLGAVTGRAVGDRLAASVAGALIAVQNGAGIVRVHDVAATRDVLAVWKATVTGC